MHIENPKDATRKLLEFINEFGKVAREIKETIPFTITSKRIKCLQINLPKEAKDLYSKNCKKKEIEDDTKR